MTLANRIGVYFDRRMWTDKMVRNAVEKGSITAADYEKITGQAYETATPTVSA